MPICEYCEVNFSSRNSLQKHRKNAKYCLNKRLLNEEENECLDIACEFCHKTFTNKRNHETHLLKCKRKEETAITLLKDELYESKEYIKKIEIKLAELSAKNEILEKHYDANQQIIKEVATKPSIGKINKIQININNRLNLSMAAISPYIENYTKEHYDQGSGGIAEWGGKYIFFDKDGQPKIECTDSSRKKFIYYDEHGNIVKDEKGDKIKEHLKPVLATKIEEYRKQSIDDLAEESEMTGKEIDRVFQIINDNKQIGNNFENRLVKIINRNKSKNEITA